MALETIGLGKLPNVYIRKITLEDYDSKSFKIDIQINVFDAIEDADFIWSNDSLLTQFMKIVVVETSSENMIRQIVDGASPHPSNIRKLSSYDTKTKIYIYGYGDLHKLEDDDDKHFLLKTSIIKPLGATTSSLFAFAYLDHREMSNYLHIKLTGALSNYMGPVVSESIISNGVPQPLTNIFKKPNGETWAGPVHTQGNEWYSGATKEAESLRLRKDVVRNTKLTDARSRHFSLRHKSPTMNLAIFSDLNYTMNNEADLFGIFSINMKQFVLNRTKFGKVIYGLAESMFEEVLMNMSLNSMEVRRRQVRFVKQTNKLGTPQFSMKDISPYSIVATLADIKNLQVHNSPNIKTYQFTDLDKNENDRGEFVYEVHISIVDNTQKYIEKVVQTLKINLNGLKDVVRRLNHTNNYNDSLDSLRRGESVPAQLKRYIDDYFLYTSMLKDMTVVEVAEMRTAKSSLFKPDTYRKRHGLRFINEYEKLFDSIVRRFGVTPKELRQTKSSPSHGYPPNVIQMTKTFSDRISFNDIATSYDILDVQSNKEVLKLTREQFEQRADREVSRFFDTSKAVSSEDLFLMDSQDANALKDLGKSKMLYMGPTAFQFQGERKSLDKIENVNLDKLTDSFLLSIKVREERDNTSKVKVNNTKSNTRAKRKSVKSPITRKRPKLNRFKFNFRPVAIKINNLSEEKSDYRESVEYLGSTSEFVNIEGNFITPAETLDAKQSLRRFKVSNEIRTKRTKKEFDLKERGNFYERLKSSKNYSPERLRDLPLATKALFNSRSTAAKNNIHESDSDILKETDTKVATEMVFHASQKIQALLGYDQTESGEILLTKPIWGDLTDEMLTNKKEILCKTIYVEVPDMGLKPSPEFMFPVQNNVFVILGDNAEQEQLVTIEDVEEQLPEVEDVVYAQSILIKQPRG